MNSYKIGAQFVYNNIKNIEVELEDSDIETIEEDLMDVILDKVAPNLAEPDFESIDSAANDDEIEAFLQKKFSNYSDIIDAATKELLEGYMAEYLVDAQDEDDLEDDLESTAPIK